MKFSVFTVMVPEWDPQTAVGKLAGYGYDGVEWRVTNSTVTPGGKRGYWDNNRCTIQLDTCVETAPEIRDMVSAAGLETAALAGYHTVDQHEATEKMLEAAAIMGAPKMRVNAPYYEGAVRYDELFAGARGDLEWTAAKAAAAGVKVCIETHMGQIAPSASAARRLLDGLDPAAVGIIYDPGNMVTEGYEQTEMGLEIMGPYLAHVHAKNGAWFKSEDAAPGEYAWSPGHATAVNEGIADWARILKALKDFGYDGYISFEDFSSGRNADEKAKFNIEYLKSLM